MHRRTFLQLAGTGLVSCASHPTTRTLRSADSGEIVAIAFDLFTLFDPRTVDRHVATLLPGVDATTFATAWKSRLFQASWQRAAAGRYLPFDALVLEALDDTTRMTHVPLSPALRSDLASAFVTLDPWPDTTSTLARFRARGLRLATLANFTPEMISTLLASAHLSELFEHEVSTDTARTYKPDPRAYALAEQRFRLPRQQIAFAAFGDWDARGAAWFGLPTFWVNRLGSPAEQLGTSGNVVASGANLDSLLTWIEGHGKDVAS